MDTRPLNAAIHKMVAHFVWTLDLLLPLFLLLLSPMPRTRPNRLEFKQMFEDAYERHCTASTEGKGNKFCTDAIDAHLLTLLQKLLTGDGESGPVTSDLPPEGMVLDSENEELMLFEIRQFTFWENCGPYPIDYIFFSGITDKAPKTLHRRYNSALVFADDHMHTGLGHWRQQQQKQWEKQIQGPNKVRYHFMYCSI
ncbi:hypothetical protein J1N35_003744 [Gossypium stocksii]|uniref:Uncharacterized protein n=1 Tax=Gossypium stocksii TaxID=47602 RepID=A0A9D3W9R9_9ROSI|nr:hypothetical protein J1N35_003744 [Gossypium stocksii]